MQFLFQWVNFQQTVDIESRISVNSCKQIALSIGIVSTKDRRTDKQLRFVAEINRELTIKLTKATEYRPNEAFFEAQQTGGGNSWSVYEFAEGEDLATARHHLAGFISACRLGS